MMRVLIVEDNPVIARLITVLLEMDGHSCESVTDDFQRLFGAHIWDDLDVLICDLRLPDVDGVDVLQWSTHQNPDLFRIAITAADHDNLIIDQARRVAHVLLHKPEDLGQLGSLIRAWGESR